MYVHNFSYLINKLEIRGYTYLQLKISENNCSPDLKRQMCKLHANVNMIIRKFSRCSPNVKYFFI